MLSLVSCLCALKFGVFDIVKYVLLALDSLSCQRCDEGRFLSGA
jgi:hypothetical protein